MGSETALISDHRSLWPRLAAIASDVYGLEKDTFGSFPKLFLTLFCPIDGPYNIISQFKPKTGFFW